MNKSEKSMHSFFFKKINLKIKIVKQDEIEIKTHIIHAFTIKRGDNIS